MRKIISEMLQVGQDCMQIHKLVVIETAESAACAELFSSKQSEKLEVCGFECRLPPVVASRINADKS